MPYSSKSQQYGTRQNPTPTQQVANANERVEALLSDYDRVTSSLEAATRQKNIHRFGRLTAFAIVIADSYFSFKALSDSAGEPWLAGGLTLFICAVQLQVNVALFNRRIYHLLRLDRNGDGKVEFSEWFRWGVLMFSIVAGYALNIGTNMIGVDSIGLGSIIFLIPGVPDWTWLAVITALLFATLLCFGDELIHSLIDSNSAALKRAIPDLQRQQAVIDARIKSTQAFRTQLMNQAESQGMKAGADYQL